MKKFQILSYKGIHFAERGVINSEGGVGVEKFHFRVSLLWYGVIQSDVRDLKKYCFPLLGEL
jgi:hypothetical protein